MPKLEPNSKELAIIVSRDSQNFESSSGTLWLRISAFLSLKSENTKRTYISVLKEWCLFLGAEAGSEKAAKLFIKASDLQAIAFRNILSRKAGQKPRHSSSASSVKEIVLSKSARQKNDGLQSTQANATIRKKLAALRRIYRMLMSANLGVAQNPFDTDKIPPPSANSGQKRPTEMIDFAKVKEVINAADPETPKGIRDRAVLSILFGGGLRRSEAVALRIADVRLTSKGTQYLHLRSTKSKKDADQALPAWAAKNLKILIEQRAKEGAKKGDYVFVSYRGKGGNIATTFPLSDSGLYKLFKKYCLLANAGDFLTPHSARATAITKLLTDGQSHRHVQEFSRHSSIQMVEVYDKRRISVDENPAKDLDFEDE